MGVVICGGQMFIAQEPKKRWKIVQKVPSQVIVTIIAILVLHASLLKRLNARFVRQESSVML
jgi:hypothetical protein